MDSVVPTKSAALSSAPAAAVVVNPAFPPPPVSAFPPPPVLLLRNAATGTSVPVPSSVVEGRSVSELRRRIRDVEPLLPGAPLAVDWERRTYRPASHAPLNVLLPMRRWWFVPIGALLIAACSQIKFFFPCLGDTVGLDGPAAGTSYCVPPSRVPAPGLPFLPSQCPADVCARRIPVTMQTWAVLLNGAIAGRFGWAATAFYVLLVCLGAPFGSNGKYDPVWEKGALVGANGGYFAGFILSSLIMGICSEKGHDRPRSSYFLVPWMLLAEGVTYACGLFWLPFGMAIARGVSPSAICPAEAGAGPCLRNIFTWGFVPFVPGELVKMVLVLVAVPGMWSIALLWHRWRRAQRGAQDGGEEEERERGLVEGDRVELVAG
jgi:biotin transport system substrate-specific component